MLTWIMAPNTSRRLSWSRTRRRQRIIQPKVPFHHPAARQDVKALWVGASDNLDDEVKEGGLVHQRRAVVARVGGEMFQPGPALPDGGEDRLGAHAVRDVGRAEVYHQQLSVGVHRDMALAPDDPPAPS